MHEFHGLEFLEKSASEKALPSFPLNLQSDFAEGKTENVSADCSAKLYGESRKNTSKYGAAGCSM